MMACPGLATSISAAVAPARSQTLPQPAPLVTGRVLRMRLADGSRQLYYLYLPRHLETPGRILVAVHGISRNAREHAERFAPLAEQAGVVLVAPRFNRKRYSRYQRLVAGPGGRRSDRMFDAVVGEVRGLVGMPDAPLYLFGYSGGAQFVHRYAMAYPRRVARAVIGAAGWYTFPDARVRYPRGLRSDPEELRLDSPACLQVPMTVVVGGDDTARDDALNQSRRIDRQQGENRRERGRRWIAAMQAAARAVGLATPYHFEVMAGVGHDFSAAMRVGNMGSLVFDHLFGDRWRRGTN